MGSIKPVKPKIQNNTGNYMKLPELIDSRHRTIIKFWENFFVPYSRNYRRNKKIDQKISKNHIMAKTAGK